MPIYEYQCSNCGHQLEVMQKMSDNPLKDCPECHKSTLNKLISAVGFQLKGTGWYVTDYSAKGKSKREQEVKQNSPDSQSKEAKSTEAKSIEAKSTETKATETKATETKATESKSMETKSKERKTKETTSIDSTKDKGSS